MKCANFLRGHLAKVVSVLIIFIVSIVCQGPATVNTQQDISFFHFAVNQREDRDYFKWTTFTTNKTFLTFPGTFTESKKNDKWAFVREELLYNFCAFTHTKNL